MRNRLGTSLSAAFFKVPRFGFFVCVILRLTALFLAVAIISPSSPLVRSLRKPGEPVPHQLKPASIEMVDAIAAVPLVMEQPGRFQHTDVARGGRPGLIEHLGDLTGCHRSKSEERRVGKECRSRW